MDERDSKRVKKEPPLTYLLKEHCFRTYSDITPNDIESWFDEPAWENPRVICPDHGSECEHCLSFCFNRELRGRPHRSLRWFLDEETDAAVLLNGMKYLHIRKDLMKHMREHEMKLRMISKKWVLEDLLLRFRGQKRGVDYIDEFVTSHGFKSIVEWYRWKDAWDRLVYEAIHKDKEGLLFCTGCGDRCDTFVAKRGKNVGETFSKCSNNRCDFFYKNGSNFATVKKH